MGKLILNSENAVATLLGTSDISHFMLGVGGNVNTALTSDTTVSASSARSGAYRAEYGFQNNSLDYNPANIPSLANPVILGRNLTTLAPGVIVKYVLKSSTDTAGFPTDWTVAVSTTGNFTGEEVTIDTQSNVSWSTQESKTFLIANAPFCNHVRLLFTDKSGGNFMQIRYLRFVTDGVRIDFSTPIDISTMVFKGSYNVGAVGGNATPSGLSFKPDGTVMYVGDVIDDATYSYNLSTPWDITTASYGDLGGGLDADTRGSYFKSDGTKIFNIDNDEDISSQPLVTPWDISSVEGRSTLSSFDSAMEFNDIYVQDEGYQFFIANDSTTPGYGVIEFLASTAYDITTISTTANAFYDVSAQTTNVRGISFSTDGLTMLISSWGDSKVYQYTLSTAWDITTTTYTGKTLTTGQYANVYLTAEGKDVYLVDQSNDTVEWYGQP